MIGGLQIGTRESRAFTIRPYFDVSISALMSSYGSPPLLSSDLKRGR